jgi:hypothetical protein
MIFDPASRRVLGSLGWVDRGAIWVFDLKGRTESRIPVDGAKFITIDPGKNGLFRVSALLDEGVEVSIRRVAEPATPLATVNFRGAEATFHGDSRLWSAVERTCFSSCGDTTLLWQIDFSSEQARKLDLSWYSSERYDLLYQGLVQSLTLPRQDIVLVSVQRGSSLLGIDVAGQRKPVEISLSDAGGNPDLRLRNDNDLIASDYDSLAFVDLTQMRVVRRVQLQERVGDVGAFIGDFDLHPNGTCAVARPFSSDAILVDSETFRVLGQATLEGQPLQICMVSDREFVTRDWKTGAVQIGEF